MSLDTHMHTFVHTASKLEVYPPPAAGAMFLSGSCDST